MQLKYLKIIQNDILYKDKFYFENRIGFIISKNVEDRMGKRLNLLKDKTLPFCVKLLSCL